MDEYCSGCSLWNLLKCRSVWTEIKQLNHGNWRSEKLTVECVIQSHGRNKQWALHNRKCFPINRFGCTFGYWDLWAMIENLWAEIRALQEVSNFPQKSSVHTESGSILSVWFYRNFKHWVEKYIRLSQNTLLPSWAKFIVSRKLGGSSCQNVLC